MLCQLDDGTRFTLPEYVRLLPRKARKQWMAEHNVHRVSEDRSPRLPESIATALGMGALPQISSFYSMFEMFQPFMVTDAVAVTAAANTALTQDVIFGLPPNVFATPGKMLWFHGVGIQSNVVTTPGTYTFILKWGGASGTALATTGAITPAAVVATNTLWYCDFYLKARATGALTTSLTLTAYGAVWMASEVVPTTQALWGARYAPPNTGTPGTALADISSLDQTISKALTLTVTPSVATGSITLRDAFIVSMN